MKRLAILLLVFVPLSACSRTSDGTVELKMAPLSLPALPRLETPDLTALWSGGARSSAARSTFPEAPPEPAAAKPASVAPARATASQVRATPARKAAARRNPVRQKPPAVQSAQPERTPVCGKAVEVDGRVRVDCT